MQCIVGCSKIASIMVSKTAFYYTGWVYMGTCLTILLRKAETYNFKSCLYCLDLDIRSTKDNMIQFYPGVLVKNTSSLGTPQGVSGLYVSGLYVELQHVADMGQKSDRQKVAMRPPGWLCKNNSSCKRSDSEQQLLPRHPTKPIPRPPRERDA
jgi:hypothetical protein